MGICVIAFLVNAVSTLLKMDADEESTVKLLQRSSTTRQHRKIAALLIARFLAFVRTRRVQERAALLAVAQDVAKEGAQPRLVRVPHRVLAPLISALARWRAYKHALNLEQRKADTAAVVDAKCTQILACLGDLQKTVTALQREVAALKTGGN
jgi:phage/plasmid-associated DNA primase